MYNFKEIDRELVNKYNDENPKGHIFQTSYWAEVKSGWKAKYIGGFDGDNLVLTCMMILRKIPYMNKYMGYSPRGFVCDYSNRALIKEFSDFIKDYGKKNSVAFITFDPDIHLKEDEKELEFGAGLRDYLISIGYQNKEAKNFENIQPNFVFRLYIDKTIEDKEERKKSLYNNFTPKTRYNIKVAQERGLSVEVYDKDNINDGVLDAFYDLMVITGKRDNFITRHREYFKNMVMDMYPYCRIYMVKYSYEKDAGRINEKLEHEKKSLERHKNKKANQEDLLAKETDASKIERINKKINDAVAGINEAERQIEGFEKHLKEIEEYRGRDIYVSGSVYLYYGGKAWYLYGASDNILRDTMPNFLMQWKMIEDSVDLDCYMYDFRGVSGDLNPENPLYGLYKFKKGFNGKFVEFVGQFDISIDGFVYGLFKTIFPQFRKIRDKVMRK